MTDMILVYITCTDTEQAVLIGKQLLKDKLAACINIIPKMHSVYLWPPHSGKLEENDEVILLVKTMESKYKQLEKKIHEIHSYQTPCILALPVLHVDEKYYKWIKEEVDKLK
jgi:periplasmic divalent cation tolerance protein